MKVLITALALVTLIASLTFAQRQYPGEFYPASYQSPAFTQSAAAARKAGRDACQSGQNVAYNSSPIEWRELVFSAGGDSVGKSPDRSSGERRDGFSHISPARSMFSKALNFCRSAIAALS